MRPRPAVLAPILMLAALLLVGVLLLLSAQPATRAQEIPTVTPFLVGTYTAPSPTPAFCRDPLPIEAGGVIVVSGGVIIRLSPDASSPLLRSFPERREFRVVSGPVCQGGFNWWQVTGHGLTGWVSEGRDDRYWIRYLRGPGEDTLDCAAPLDLSTGESFDLLYNARLRADADIDALTVTVVQADSRVSVLEGPVCADGYNWWRVRASVLGLIYEGWMAEALRTGEALIDAPPEGDGTFCAVPLPLDIGDNATVSYKSGPPKRLRNAPDLNAAVLYDLVRSVPLVIEGGPVCADSYNWWQVSIRGRPEVVGWMAEGGPPEYWIASNEPVYNTPDALPTQRIIVGTPGQPVTAGATQAVTGAATAFPSATFATATPFATVTTAP